MIRLVIVLTIVVSSAVGQDLNSEMRALSSGSDQEIRKLATAWRLERPARHGETTSHPCMDFEVIKQWDVSFSHGQAHKVLQVLGRDCDILFLVVFKLREGIFARESTLGLFAKHWLPDVEVSPLVEPGIAQIIIRGRIVVYGTGEVQKNFTVFRIQDGEFIVVLDEVMSSHFEIPSHQQTVLKHSEKAEFHLVRKKLPAVVCSIRTLSNGSRTFINRRVFRWNDMLGRFEGTFDAENKDCRS